MRLPLSTLAVYFFILLVFVVEGLGLPNGRQYARLILGVSPFILFAIDIVKKKKIQVPLTISLLFILFSITTAISTITAVNIQTAFENQLMYWGVFLTFIYVFNHQEIKESVPLFIFFITLILAIYAIFITFFLPINWSWLIPRGGFQFAYIHNTANSHFAFGSFILIPLIFIYKYFVEKPTWKFGLSLGIFLILLIISFLRAAYVAFLVVVVLNFYTHTAIKNRKLFVLLICSIFLIFISSFILITNFQNEILTNLPFKNIFTNHFELLKYKTFLNGRDEFINQAFEAIKARPLSGFGSFNYYYASLLYAKDITYTTGTSHNMFVDIFVENGVLGGFIFLTLFVYLIKQLLPVLKSKEKIEVSILYVIISLLVLFQLSHYHKFYFLLFFLFFVSALIYKEKTILKDSKQILFVSSGLLFLLSSVIALALVFSNTKDYKKSLAIYPISVSTYQSYIVSFHTSNQFDKADIYLKQLSELYPREPNVQDFIGNMYTLYSKPQNAIKHYKAALQSSPLEVAYITFIFNELEKIEGTQRAKEFVEQYILENKNQFKKYIFADKWFYEWCVEREIDIYKYMSSTVGE